MAAEADKESGFVIKYLNPVLHPIGYPDVAIAVNGYTLWPREIAGAIARLAKGTDELAITIEDLNAVVQGVGDVEVAVGVDCQPAGLSEIAGSCECVVLAGSADGAFQFEAVGVVHQDLVKRNIGDVQEPI